MCSELLFYLPEQATTSLEFVTDNGSQMDSKERRTLRFVHSCFDCKEFKRAARLSEGFHHSLTRFLHYYARYLDGEQQKLDNMADVMDKSLKFKNEEVQSLCEDILETMTNSSEVDPYLNYLFGLVLVEMNMNARAINCLVDAVNTEPILWPAWLQLSKLIDSKEQLSKLNLPDNWMKQFMFAEVYGRWQMPQEALQIYEELRDAGFGQCPYITTHMASACHTLQELDRAVELFQELFNQDPYRLDQMDVYSNTLFVKELRIELAKLAHHCYKVNKFCPETCGVVGNYYTIRGDHEKAVLYFQRALKLDPSNGGAWTLMGHTFMELKNTAAASLAYRHAVEINPKDYRAWYSLGQLYDILRMPSYAMYYYNLAHRTKPQDSRMLMALGEMLSQQNRTSDAKKCFWKAHCVGDIEGLAIVKLANRYRTDPKLLICFESHAMKWIRTEGRNHGELSCSPWKESYGRKY